MEKEKINVNSIIDDEARATVGKLCKRVELLQKRDDIPYEEKERLFKALAKELIYESSRSLKKLLEMYGMYKNIELTEFRRRR